MEESEAVQRILTELGIASHLVALMRFHQDESSENITRYVGTVQSA